MMGCGVENDAYMGIQFFGGIGWTGKMKTFEKAATPFLPIISTFLSVFWYS